MLLKWNLRRFPLLVWCFLSFFFPQSNSVSQSLTLIPSCPFPALRLHFSLPTHLPHSQTRKVIQCNDPVCGRQAHFTQRTRLGHLQYIVIPRPRQLSNRSYTLNMNIRMNWNITLGWPHFIWLRILNSQIKASFAPKKKATMLDITHMFILIAGERLQASL